MTQDLTRQLRRLADATDPSVDRLTLDELQQRTPAPRGEGRGRLPLAAAVTLLVLALAATAIGVGAGGDRSTSGGAPGGPPASVDTGARPWTTAPDDVAGTWTPGTRDLPETDPVVQAVLALLPAGARFVVARDSRSEWEGGASFVQVIASDGDLELEVSVHRTFDPDELSTPERVPGG